MKDTLNTRCEVIVRVGRDAVVKRRDGLWQPAGGDKAAIEVE